MEEVVNLDEEEMAVVNLLQSNFSPNRNIHLISPSTIARTDCSEKYNDNNQALAVCKEIIWKMKLVYPQISNSFLEQQLTDFIHRKCSDEITGESFKDIEFELEKLHNNTSNLEIDKKELFYAALLFGRYLQQSRDKDKAYTLPDSYKYYSAFESIHAYSDEMRYLLTFWTMMRVALEVIPANRNKMLIISICAMLEGSGRTYITGGTQSLATSRRMIIFEHESGLARICHKSNQHGAVESKQAIKCTCGAVIMKRTMWKHSKSMKHKRRVMLKLVH